MSSRLFLFSHRVRLFLVALGIVALAAPAATAALKKYDVRKTRLLHYQATSPHVEFSIWPGGIGKAVIDESGANPALKKFIIVVDQPTTVIIPILGPECCLWYNQKFHTGPEADEVGSGSTASSITWGDVTGWTVTGGAFCHAGASYICSLLDAIHDETVDPVLVSDNYDIGSWTFHGTGFTATPFVHETGASTLGNLQWLLRGTLAQDGTVPALPLLGIGAVGVSVFAMGVASLRRRRK